MRRPRSLLSTVLHALLPARCLFCGAPAQTVDLCQACIDDLPGRKRARCPVCALPQPTGQICGRCLGRPPACSRTIAAADYAFPLDGAIGRLKYGADLSLLGPLAHLIVEAVLAAPPVGAARADVLIPMPLSPEAQRMRGFNQALELARPVARALGVRLAPDAAMRVRATAPQASLPFDARTRNMRGAFACDGSLAGLHVAILDDVMTTGATLHELAGTLRRAGVADVSGWVLARTPPHA